MASNAEPVEVPQEEEEEEKKEEESASRSKWSFLPLAAFILCFYTAMIALHSLIPQYIFNRLLEENGLPASYSNASDCHINKSDPMYKQREEIQAQSSLIASKCSIMEGIPQIIMVMIYGSYSDEMGRKLTILVPYFGGAVWAISVCLMITLNLPIYTYYIGSIINGFSGSYGTMLAGAFAYLADSTTTGQRTLAIGMLEGSLGLSMVIANFGIGYWLKAAGAKIPSIATTALLCVSPIFMFCVRESRVRSPPSSQRSQSSCQVFQFLKRQLKKIKALFTADRQRGFCLGLCILAFSEHLLSFMGTASVLTLYALNEPFCWTSQSIGIYSGMKSAFWQLGMVCTLLLLRKRVSDWCLALMALTSAVFYNGLLAAASSFEFPLDDILMMTAAVSGVFSSLCSAMIRSICSKLVDPNEQGVMFATFAAAETIAIVAGVSILNPIYAVTIKFYDGFVFALVAFLSLITVGILAGAHHMYRRRVANEYSILEEDPTIQGDKAEE